MAKIDLICENSVTSWHGGLGQRSKGLAVSLIVIGLAVLSLYLKIREIER